MARLALVALFVAGAVAGLFAFLNKTPSELPVYVLGAERMQQGIEIYRTGDAKPFTYPPFFALPFLPLVGWPMVWQRTAWYVVTLLALMFVVRRLAHLVAPDLAAMSPRARVMFWVLLAAIAGRHVLAIFENQSHDMLVLACVVAASVAWAEGGAARAGAWAGLGAACKATPGLFAVPFLLHGSWRALFAAGVVGAAATLLPDLVLPRADGQLWVMAWAHTMLAGVRPGAVADLSGTWTAGSVLNQSLSGTLYRLTTPMAVTPGASASPWELNAAVVALSPGTRSAVTLGAQLAVLALVAWVARPRALSIAAIGNACHARFAQAAAVACGMVLLSPMSSKSHFGVLLLPATLGLVLTGRGRRDAVLVGLLVLMFVVGTLTTKGLVGTQLGNVLLAHGSVAATAVLGLLVAARAASLVRRPTVRATAVGER